MATTTHRTQPKRPRRPAPDKPLELGDLSDEQRQVLLQQLAEEQAAVAAEPAEVAAAARDRQIAKLMHDRDHMRNCPVENGEGGRVEAYASTRPADPRTMQPERPVTVVRCIECGGSTVLDTAYPVVVAALGVEPIDDDDPDND